MLYDIDFDSGIVYPDATIVDLAVVADNSGFDAIWKGESNSADPMVVLSAMAARTRNVKLGTGVYHIFGRSPVTLGIQAETLNDLSGGRLLLGIGVSNRTLAAWHGREFDRPVRRLREYAEIVRAVARGERVDYGGETESVSGFKLSWRPSHPEVPISFAALGDQMTRLAGRSADGVMINMANPAMVRDIVQRVREGATAGGRDPDTLEYMVKVRVCLHTDRKVARTRLKHALAFYSIAEFYRDHLAAMGFGEEAEAVSAAYQQSGFRAAQQAVPDTMLDGLPTIAAASAEEAREQLRPYAEAGATRLIIPYVCATEDAVGETRRFLESWGA
jgi:probable F420-dependent oxidoreductase